MKQDLGAQPRPKTRMRLVFEEVVRPAEVREIGLRSTGMYLPVTGPAMMRLATAAR